MPVVDTAAFPSLPLTGCGLFSQPAHRQEQLGTVVQSQLVRLRPTEEHKEECERGKGLSMYMYIQELMRAESPKARRTFYCYMLLDACEKLPNMAHRKKTKT